MPLRWGYRMDDAKRRARREGLIAIATELAVIAERSENAN